MIKTTKRPNGYYKRIQSVSSPRKGISSMGSPFIKGDPIVHFSSSRCTGETFVLTIAEVRKILESPLSRWHSPKKWSDQLGKEWVRKYGPREEVCEVCSKEI